jgi:hypothetical protein
MLTTRDDAKRNCRAGGWSSLFGPSGIFLHLECGRLSTEVGWQQQAAKFSKEV